MKIRIFSFIKNKIIRYRWKQRGVLLIGNGKNLSIHPTATFGGYVTIYGTAPVTIEENSMIGLGTIIHTSTHDPNVHPMSMRRIDKPVFIGKNVWIGTACIILPGVKIGDNSIIGAGSVVNKNIPPNITAAGCPANFIRLNANIYDKTQITTPEVITATYNNKEL